MVQICYVSGGMLVLREESPNPILNLLEYIRGTARCVRETPTGSLGRTWRAWPREEVPGTYFKAMALYLSYVGPTFPDITS